MRALLDALVAAQGDEPLSIRRDARLVLDLGLHVVDGGGATDPKVLEVAAARRAPRALRDQDAHGRERRRRRAACHVVLELLAGEDHAVLVRLDAFLVLDLGLRVVDVPRSPTRTMADQARRGWGAEAWQNPKVRGDSGRVTCLGVQ